MGVGIAFLRPRADGTWEGDHTLVGWGTFGKFQDLLLSLPGLLDFLSYREDEYGVELGEGPPPHPAWVTPEPAKDLEGWRERVGPSLPATLCQVSVDEIREYLYSFKTMINESAGQNTPEIGSPLWSCGNQGVPVYDGRIKAMGFAKG